MKEGRSPSKGVSLQSEMPFMFVSALSVYVVLQQPLFSLSVCGIGATITTEVEIETENR